MRALTQAKCQSSGFLFVGRLTIVAAFGIAALSSRGLWKSRRRSEVHWLFERHELHNKSLKALAMLARTSGAARHLRMASPLLRKYRSTPAAA